MALLSVMQATVLFLGILVPAFKTAGAQPIGVCNGRNLDPRPSEEDTVRLYKDNGIGRMRLYDPLHATLDALRGSNIELILDVPNTKLESLQNPDAAKEWVQDNILNYQDVQFRYIAVGNEVDPDNDSSQYLNFVLPAMRNVHDAIVAGGLQDQIKVSTATYSGLLGRISSPPSQGAFKDSAQGFMQPIIQFLADNNSPLLANIYPYFSYRDNPNEDLQYALFEPTNTVVSDEGTGLQYTNLFDAMLDAMYSAVEKLSDSNINIVVSESGWPSEAGKDTTVENAGTYYKNLINHVKETGTPKKPGNIETFLFAMFDENLKEGDETEKHFGLFDPATRQPKPDKVGSTIHMESSLPSDRHVKSHCFFKIIISEISSESKLMVPEKFVKKYGTELHGQVRLKAAGGAPWRVDLQRKQGKVWLRNGWPEFATFYSLRFGHSVLFKYQGNCDFEVVIFDTSATEIDYPKTMKGRANDELRACKKKRVQSGLKENHRVGDRLMQKLQKEKFAKASLDNETSSSEEERGDMMKRPVKLEVDLNNPVQQHDDIRGKLISSSVSKLFSNKFYIFSAYKLHAGKEECKNACASANAFKSSFPFFIKVMKPSFVGKTQGWFAKKADLKTYMKDRVEVLIIRLGKRTWLVKFRVESNRVKVGLGWQQFAEDNALAVGDVCVFELVEPSKKLLQVTIFKAEPVSGS